MLIAEDVPLLGLLVEIHVDVWWTIEAYRLI
jgi:hypothetical protein